MNRVLRLALLQTVIFVSIVFFFYVSVYGIRTLLMGDDGGGWFRHAFWVSSLVSMLATIQVLLRPGQAIYPWLTIGSSLLAAASVFIQGIAPLLALMPVMNALSVAAFQRQRRTV